MHLHVRMLFLMRKFCLLGVFRKESKVFGIDASTILQPHPGGKIQILLIMLFNRFLSLLYIMIMSLGDAIGISIMWLRFAWES
jgi:hypothetical protein